jgi:hypothetical protein
VATSVRQVAGGFRLRTRRTLGRKDAHGQGRTDKLKRDRGYKLEDFVNLVYAKPKHTSHLERRTRAISAKPDNNSKRLGDKTTAAGQDEAKVDSRDYIILDLPLLR